MIFNFLLFAPLIPLIFIESIHGYNIINNVMKITNRDSGINAYFSDNFEDYTHLDKKNLDKLEKLFNLKSRRYSPYRNIIHIKYKNQISNKINITDILKDLNNTDLINKNLTKDDLDEDEFEQYNLFLNIKNETLSLNEDNQNYPNFDEEFNNHNNPNINRKGLGYFDPFGIFRYNQPNYDKMPIPSKNRPYNGDFRKGSSNGNRNERSNSGEFSNDNSFEIIKNPTHTFKDVGGYDKIKSELMQTADILTNYEKYSNYSVRTPKGIIFEGPPGNGKTLMAKGFSGEINASFIPVSGSEFSEKFVGVGASRVRDLFKLASENKPCIIFIDEIDAVARKRGNDAVSSNSEKDQTLNQLLIALDGFKSSNGIFLIGATNRIDLLDPALIRPGRIDKNIYIGNPDSKTREEIIKIHLNGKPIDPNITIDYIVEMSGGMSGAQTENLLNEAMLNSLRENRTSIIAYDLEYIANRIIAGWQATESKFSDDMINRIVVHEMGHAITGFFSPEHSNLIKVCLNTWSPRSPGYTIFESNDENSNIYTKDSLVSHIMVLLGGRVAEEIFYGYSVTTGAKKDFEEAYKLAQNMILEYGMGKQSIYPYLSEQSKFLIDQEINSLLLEAHEKACLIITNCKDLITECGYKLKKDKLLKPIDIIEIIDNKFPELWNIYKNIDKR